MTERKDKQEGRREGGEQARKEGRKKERKESVTSVYTQQNVNLSEQIPSLQYANRLVGLVVKASTSRAEDPGFESRWRRDFFGFESYQ